MRIPLTTTKPRYYVATSETHAFSSWDTQEDAALCIHRFRRTDSPDKDRIRGIIETGPEGRRWANTT